MTTQDTSVSLSGDGTKVAIGAPMVMIQMDLIQDMDA